MLRLLAGKSEIKFIVSGDETLRAFQGAASDARGIRLLALLLPRSKRAGIEQRLADSSG
jgi:hypothetical protein